MSFFDSLVKIGQGFQEIFGFFGNAIGDSLGLTVVKSGDKRDKVGKHFEEIGKGLTATKDKLKDLSGKISEVTNADGSTIKIVEGAIQSASEVFDKLIDSVTKLASVTNDSTDIGAGHNAAGSVAAHKESVDTIIKEVRAIIETYEGFGVKIEKGTAGVQVANGNGPKSVVHNAQAVAGDATKLADEVAKADPWAMLDKIRDAKTDNFVAAGDNNAGQLAIGGNVANNGTAATNADLAAAVALKAMTKDGKFTQPADADSIAVVKGAAASAVNKVLGVLNVVIQRTVSSQLEKIGEAVKGIKYSETTTESTEASTTQPAATK
ncbi:variable large family protein (plasmid) [Borrelia turicatae]|nr:variable large family protein [Borrelia turicatae]UPA15802.1 variable large family protein [Borrelia turicatae]